MSRAARFPSGARVGVFGGTFNPIHLGHLRSAEEVVEALGLERMVFVPSAQPPHKETSEGDPIAPAAERLAWVRAAIRDNPRFEVDALELERSGPSYSVDTLRALGEQTAPELPVFVVGRDAFTLMGSWRDPEAVFGLAHFAVMTRPGVGAEDVAGGGAPSLEDWLPEAVRDAFDVARGGREARHRSRGTWVRIVEISSLEISASDIRARLRAGRSIRYLVPEVVRGEVESSGVYAPGAHGDERGKRRQDEWEKSRWEGTV